MGEQRVKNNILRSKKKNENTLNHVSHLTYYNNLSCVLSLLEI